MSHAFSFPTMTGAEITPHISALWGLDIEPEALRRPTSTLVAQLYENAVRFLTGVTPETLGGVQMRFLAEIEFAVSVFALCALTFRGWRCRSCVEKT